MENLACPVCGCDKPKKIADIGITVFRCPDCTLEYVNTKKMFELCDVVTKTSMKNKQEYTDMLKSLEPLRISNNKKIIDRMSSFLPEESNGLEVGCAVGFFLEQANKKYKVSGIEPMEKSFEISKSKGLDVVHGYFPGNVDFSKKYDFVIFNDVFEHIPDIHSVMSSCQNLLKDNGFLLINLPDSDGILHKISKLLCRLGDQSSLKRLWQLGTESPHLYYFNSRSLDLLNEKHGFHRTGFLKLDSFSKNGLSKRLAAISMGKIRTYIYNIGLTLLFPALRAMYSDTNLYIYQKNNSMEK